MKDTKVTLKNLKIAQFASEETLCFEATLYVDGTRAAVVSNEGQGGPNRYHPVNAKGRELLEKAEAYAKGLPPLQSDYGPLDFDLDLLVHDLVERYEETKTLKRWSKTKTVFRLPEDEKGAWRTVNQPYNQRVVDYIRGKYPNAEIINPAEL